MKGVTPYQLEMLQKMVELQECNKQLPDFDQLLGRLTWKPTKASAQFTIRAVIGKGLIKKEALQSRRGRLRVCYSLTEDGKLVLDPRVVKTLEPLKTSAEADLFDPRKGSDEFNLEEFFEE